MTKQVSQKTQIQTLLNRGRVLTATELRNLGIAKPSARITELRNAGVNIVTTEKKGESAWRLPKVAKSVKAPAFASPVFSF